MKKNFLKNDRGYTLLLSIVVIVIFSILGLSLMAITSNGVAKNENRQDRVQAHDLADKGLDIIVKDIQKYLETQIKDTPMGKTAFEKLLIDTLKKSSMQCPADGSIPTGSTGITVPGNNGTTTRICIVAVDEIKNAANIVEEKDRYKRIVTFRSYGLANGKQVISTYKVILGTDAIPDQLRYAVSSNENGSVYIYGGVDITGDIKTAKDLVIHNQGYSLSGTTPNWHNSVYLRMKSDIKSVTPKIIFPETGSLYINKSTSHLNSENKILTLDVTKNKDKYTQYQATNSSLVNNLRSTLFDSANVSTVSKSLESDEVKVSEKVLNLYNSKEYSKFYNSSLTISNSNKTNVHLSKDDVILVGKTNTVNTTCKTYDRRNRCTSWNTREELAKGSFKISNASSVNLRGQYYVYGDLAIENSSLNSDAIIYVDGDVEITDSTLSGLGSNGTLIIFATGEIRIINISKYSENASRIKGFFYSQDTLNMFGVLSNIQIQGGISAKNIVLSAIRGKYTSSGATDSRTLQLNLYDHDRNTNTPPIPQKNSRLTIIYDQDLIESFTSFKRDEEEEFITSINEPEIIDRY